jgi:hypothetical protein
LLIVSLRQLYVARDCSFRLQITMGTLCVVRDKELQLNIL